MSSDPGDVTRLLHRLRNGDQTAESPLFELLYKDLRRIAAAMIRGGRDAKRGISPTSLVNDLYVSVRVNAALAYDWKNRQQFIAVMAKAMRRSLIDLARRNEADKRCHEAVSLERVDVQVQQDLTVEQRLMIDGAVEEVRQRNPFHGQIIDAYYYCGLTLVETAELLEVSRSTVDRELKFLRAWLTTRLNPKKGKK